MKALKALKRASRSAIQLSFVEAVIQLLLAFNLNLTETQHVAILGVATPIISFIQNLLEDNEILPPLLKGS